MRVTRHVPGLKYGSAREQANLFRRLDIGRRPCTHRSAGLALVLGRERERNAPVYTSGKDAQPLVEDTKGNDGQD